MKSIAVLLGISRVYKRWCDGSSLGLPWCVSINVGWVVGQLRGSARCKCWWRWYHCVERQVESARYSWLRGNPWSYGLICKWRYSYLYSVLHWLEHFFQTLSSRVCVVRADFRCRLRTSIFVMCRKQTNGNVFGIIELSLCPVSDSPRTHHIQRLTLMLPPKPYALKVVNNSLRIFDYCNIRRQGNPE